MTWRATVLTIFPEMLPGPLAHSLAGKALRAGLWRLETVDIRDFARDKHRSVDDAPFGGGPGMVIRPDVLDAAVAGVRGVGPVILLSPRGERLDQQRVGSLAEESFTEGLLEYPQYTRPQLWQGRAVPEVLVSGDHRRIKEWRRAAAERLTRERRPDLWERYLARQRDGDRDREAE